MRKSLGIIFLALVFPSILIAKNIHSAADPSDYPQPTGNTPTPQTATIGQNYSTTFEGNTNNTSSSILFTDPDTAINSLVLWATAANDPNAPFNGACNQESSAQDRINECNASLQGTGLTCSWNRVGDDFTLTLSGSPTSLPININIHACNYSGTSSTSIPVTISPTVMGPTYSFTNSSITMNQGTTYDQSNTPNIVTINPQCDQGLATGSPTFTVNGSSSLGGITLIPVPDTSNEYYFGGTPDSTYAGQPPVNIVVQATNNCGQTTSSSPVPTTILALPQAQPQSIAGSLNQTLIDPNIYPNGYNLSQLFTSGQYIQPITNYSFSLKLPDGTTSNSLDSLGLSLDPTTGVLTSTTPVPATAETGDYILTVEANNNSTITSTLTITINQAPTPQFTGLNSTMTMNEGTTYTQTNSPNVFTITPGTGTCNTLSSVDFSVDNSALGTAPVGGISLTQGTEANQYYFGGTPDNTYAGQQVPVTVVATNNCNGKAQAQISATILALPTASPQTISASIGNPVIDTTKYPNGYELSQLFSSGTNIQPTTTFTLENMTLPGGGTSTSLATLSLQLDSTNTKLLSTGSLPSNTPTGTYVLTFEANNNPNLTSTLTITVNQAAAPTLSLSTNPMTFNEGTAYTQSNSPNVFTITAAGCGTANAPEFSVNGSAYSTGPQGGISIETGSETNQYYFGGTPDSTYAGQQVNVVVQDTNTCGGTFTSPQIPTTVAALPAESDQSLPPVSIGSNIVGSSGYNLSQLFTSGTNIQSPEPISFVSMKLPDGSTSTLLTTLPLTLDSSNTILQSTGPVSSDITTGTYVLTFKALSTNSNVNITSNLTITITAPASTISAPSSMTMDQGVTYDQSNTPATVNITSPDGCTLNQPTFSADGSAFDQTVDGITLAGSNGQYYFTGTPGPTYNGKQINIVVQATNSCNTTTPASATISATTYALPQPASNQTALAFVGGSLSDTSGGTSNQGKGYELSNLFTQGPLVQTISSVSYSGTSPSSLSSLNLAYSSDSSAGFLLSSSSQASYTMAGTYSLQFTATTNAGQTVTASLPVTIEGYSITCPDANAVDWTSAYPSATVTTPPTVTYPQGQPYTFSYISSKPLPPFFSQYPPFTAKFMRFMLDNSTGNNVSMQCTYYNSYPPAPAQATISTQDVFTYSQSNEIAQLNPNGFNYGFYITVNLIPPY